jgi:hypothetical protein
MPDRKRIDWLRYSVLAGNSAIQKTVKEKLLS